MSDRITRDQEVSDAEMLDSANSFSDELSNYYAKFTMLNPVIFDENFILLFREAIAAAEAIPSDNVLIDKQAKETEDVNLKRKQCVGEVSLAKYYIDLAFHGRKTIMNQFGYNDLNKVRDSNKAIVLFMSDFIQEIKNNMDTLAASGYPESKPELLDQLFAELRQERSEQKAAANDRHRMTEERVHALNHVWDLMTVISNAKEHALPDDPVAQQIFTLPRRAPGSSAE